jgi:hypothetical protein
VTPSPARRATLLAGGLLTVALVASGCGGSDPAAHDEPAAASSTSRTPSSTPAPSPTEAPTEAPTPTTAPLSAFEDKAPVKAARAFTAATAHAVNDRDRSLAAVVPLTTARGLSQTRDYYAKDDLAHGYLQPGPEPFTPVSVKVTGTTARLDVCLQTQGWSRDRKTGTPVGRRTVDPIVFEMHKVGGVWKFDSYYTGTAHCGGVTVRGVRW